MRRIFVVEHLHPCKLCHYLLVKHFTVKKEREKKLVWKSMKRKYIVRHITTLTI